MDTCCDDIINYIYSFIEPVYICILNDNDAASFACSSKYHNTIKQKLKRKITNVRNRTQTNAVEDYSMESNNASTSDDQGFVRSPVGPYTITHGSTPTNSTSTQEREATTADKLDKNTNETEMEKLCSYLDKLALWISISLFALFHIAYMLYY